MGQVKKITKQDIENAWDSAEMAYDRWREAVEEAERIEDEFEEQSNE